MAKRAVLVGCNYPGSNAALAGCVNDAFMVKEFLMEYKGFEEGNIKVLIDTDEAYTSPTGSAIKAALDEMCSAAEQGDYLVFHFSGHGTQVPSDGDDDESDHKDEAICPTDLNLIVDDDLKAIVGKIPDGTNFTFISDCCHSGSMLDHAAVVIDGPKAGGEGQHLPEPESLVSMLGGTKDIDPSEIGVASRELKPDLLANLLSSKLGKTVSTRDIRGGLSSLFGPEASGFISSFLSNPQVASQVNSLLGGIPGGSSGLSSLMGGFGGAAPAAPAAPTRPPQPDPLSPDKGILITGCQSSETSADVRPPGGDAFGALTHTLISTAKETPDAPYIDIVTKVRSTMVEKKFSQNPCLECSEMNAGLPFICP